MVGNVVSIGIETTKGMRSARDQSLVVEGRPLAVTVFAQAAGTLKKVSTLQQQYRDIP